MATKLKTQACGTCGGSGALPADDVGEVLREEREKFSITGVDLAAAMNISVSYLYDLEKGHRKWTNELLGSYQRALEGLRNGK